MPNVKPGDMCIVIGNSPTGNPHICSGKIVTVLFPAVDGEYFTSLSSQVTRLVSGTKKTWVVESSDLLPWVLEDGSTEFYKKRPIPDSYLFKIKGSDLSDEEETPMDKLKVDKVKR